MTNLLIPGLFEQVMARLNLEHIEDHPILKKPPGKHRFGGNTALGQGFDTAREAGYFDRRIYDMLANRIAEVAARGGTPRHCVR